MLPLSVVNVILVTLLFGGTVNFAQEEEMPQFFPSPHNNRYSVTINQNYVIGNKIIQVECTGRNGTEIVYGIISSENYFTINNASGIISLNINARDLPGDGPHTAIMYCNFIDNDHSSTVELSVSYRIENVYIPMFTHGDRVLNISVREDHIERESPIIARLNITDDDLAPCNIVTFAIVSGNDDRSFRIGSESGVLELNMNLNYESHPNKYTLTIEATNIQCGDRQYSDLTTVCVYVEDTDDEHPMFEQHMFTFTFDEGQQPLNFVQLRCSDLDSPGVQIVYDEDFSQNQIPFTISHQTGNVSATEKLDYEQQISYNLTFICYNVLNSNVRDAAVVIINVSPINEDLPRVQPISSFTQLDYTTPIGTLLVSARDNAHAPITIIATDSDSGLDHGKIRFTLQESEYSRYFHLDTDSGNLTIARRFDFDVCGRDRVTSFRLRLVACDSLQNSSRYQTCPITTIYVSIVIESSSSPGVCTLAFLKMNYTVRVSESATLESELLMVHCGVLGGGPLQQHAIKIIAPNSNLSQTLRIDNDSVILQQRLDYESVQNFTVGLNCLNSDGQVSTASLVVQILPENDNPPHFEKSFYVFSISFKEISTLPVVIGYITAMDDDKGIIDNLTYALNLKGDNDSSTEYIILNATTGNRTVALSLINYPREIESLVYDISVCDGNHSAHSNVIITIFDAMSTPLNESQCGTVCQVLVVLTAAIATILLVILILCYAAREHLKWLRRSKLTEITTRKADLKLHSCNSYQISNAVTVTENVDTRIPAMELPSLEPEIENKKFPQVTRQAYPANDDQMHEVIPSSLSMEYIYINANQ